ncbi:methionine-synthesizing 5-methyltetrahydropteroyltriglutamate--homocysteine methyltransferase [Hanseniaspora osmophila]|uniref:5-methyltetrahydropteroyltriglutamate--homocysteine S-methyltransferase n=1 Tax=Hanseniaspora osmophila TaxID=56408 RepID=A0A1E5RAL2_9ASCO|nr:5-methyltetrahydropteroyltriglutamate--homocysteine methyltransferase [Hanseniaspora osmophila]
MVASSVLGFPRIGAKRELKKATESYWAGKITSEELFEIGSKIRTENWKLQKDAGVDIIASNDFSFYDQVLDLSLLFNVIPDRYTKYGLSPIDTLFAMGRGLQKPADEAKGIKAIDVTALEMVKWFDSNYHYVRPTFSHSTEFKLNGSKPVDEFLEAKKLGVETRPVLLGPISYLFLGKADKDSLDLDPISLLEKLLPVYIEVLNKLKEAGAKSVQLDEPVLVFDLPQNVQDAYQGAYEKLAKGVAGLDIVLTTYFGDVRPNLKAIANLPVSGFHFDFTRCPEQFDEVVAILKDSQKLSVGIVDGRNVWKNKFGASLKLIQSAVDKVGSDRVIVATSSSLLHTPVDLDNETSLSEEIKGFFSFAKQKLSEVVTLSAKINGSTDAAITKALEENAAYVEARNTSKIINNPEVQKRVAAIDSNMGKRQNAFPARWNKQKAIFKFPLFPTTTIGSFPQTKEIRINRNKFQRGKISAEEYEKFINEEIERVIRFQEEIDLDVLVHGEPERNDMTAYFGEQINGYAFTTNGWVQSYGSRYVRPPVIVGDLSRPKPMSVKESVYAQSITTKHVKGMLTGPITMLRWSFPRDDLDQKTQAYQLSLVLRDEVNDLEAAGIKIIQVDEPALREGLPLRAGAERNAYYDWAAESFRISTSGVADETQIHSHFCYSDLDPNHIKALDADVVSIEYSKKDDPSYISEFKDYPNHVGLGLFDIHSPRIPSKEEFIEKMGKILETYDAAKFWVNPDCGLKTRGWEETKLSLSHMVEAAKYFRGKYAK